MRDLTAFQRDCLIVIAGLDAPKGLAIKAELDDYYAVAVNHGQLYPNLDELVDLGLVEKDDLDGRTNSYEVTTEGEQALEARREWADTYL